MNRKKGIAVMLAAVLSVMCVACAGLGEGKEKAEIKPQISQMKSICELAAMECYYHNVAKYYQKDAQKTFIWKKDKHFWIEYSGVVKLGIDASLLNIAVKGEKVTITLPPAKVLSSKVDEASLNKASFIVETGSADVKAEDETQAYKEAQANMENAAAKDSTLLSSAQQRVQVLLEEYVHNIGDAVGKEYVVEWKYIDADTDAGEPQ